MPNVTTIPTSGIGSWPGTDIDEAVRQVFDLVSVPYLPELPARGPGSDMVGRTLGLLEGLACELSPTGWRVAHRSGADQRRARARLRDDLDVLEERASGTLGSVKVAMCGWWTLAASVELNRGGRLLRDPGAVRDVVDIARGAAHHLRDEVQRRLPAAEVLLQLDEPALPAVLAGSVPNESGLGRLRAVEIETVSRSFVGLPEGTIVHSCAQDVPIAALRQAGIRQLAVDGGLVSVRGWDALAEHIDSGGTLWLGVVPTEEAAVPTVDALMTRALAWLRPLELGPRLTGRLILTPACGLAATSGRDAVLVSEALARAADLLAEELLR